MSKALTAQRAGALGVVFYMRRVGEDDDGEDRGIKTDDR